MSSGKNQTSETIIPVILVLVKCDTEQVPVTSTPRLFSFLRDMKS